MTENKDLAVFIVFGISIYLFIEAFTNFALYINAVIFLRWKDLSVVLGWIILYLFVLFGIITSFSLKKLTNSQKIYILLFIIPAFRILTQVYLIGEIYLLFLTVLFASLLLILIEFFIMTKESNINSRTLLGAIIFGIGIYLFLLTLNLTSNLSVEVLKIPIVITFTVILLILNIKSFNPKSYLERERPHLDTSGENTLELPIIHFFLFGILLFFGLSWLVNPMSLAAYDIYILNWYEYSFMYYTIIIMSALITSYFLMDYLLKKVELLVLRRVLILFNAIFCGINCLALFIIDTESTILSTIYLSILTCISIFTIVLDLGFILERYTLKNRKKRLFGIIVLIFGFVFSYAIAIIFTWSLYLSLLITTLILAAVYFGIFMGIEIRNVSRHKKVLMGGPNRNKIFSLVFIILLALNISAIALITLQRSYEAPSSGNPTIMSWNIHNGIGSDGEFDLDRIIEEIKEYNPDILGLNEVDMGVMKTSFVDITSYFAEHLDMYYFYGPTFFKHYGNAIFSKYPFEEVETIDLPVVEGIHSEPRGVIKAKVDIDGEIWTIYVNHLATNEEHRKEQVPFVVELMEEEDFERVIWMGDFNMQPDSKPYELVNSTSNKIQLRDTHFYLGDPKDTGGFDPNNDFKPTNRIDYIFCSPDLIPTKVKVHWSLASDHCAVVAEF